MSFDMRVVPIVIVATIVGTLVLVAIIYMIYRTQLRKKQQRTETGLSEKAALGNAARKPRHGQRKTNASASLPKRISLLTSLPTKPTRRFQHESSPLPGPGFRNLPNPAKPRGLRRKSSISNLEEGALSVTEKNHKMLDKIDRDFVSSPPSVHLSSGRSRDGGAQHQFFALNSERILPVGGKRRPHLDTQSTVPVVKRERASLPDSKARTEPVEKRKRSSMSTSKEIEPSARLLRSAETARLNTHDGKLAAQHLPAAPASAKPKSPRSPAAMVLQPPSPPRRSGIHPDTIKAASISAMPSLFFDPRLPKRDSAGQPANPPQGKLPTANRRSSHRASAPVVMAGPAVRKETQSLQPFSPSQRLTSMLEETSTSDSPNSAAANSSNSSKSLTRQPLRVHTKRLSTWGETSFLESASTSDPGVLDLPIQDKRRSRHSINSSTITPTYTVNGVMRIPIMPAPRPRSMNPRISRYPPAPPPKDPTGGGKPLPSPPPSVPPSIISDWRTDDSRSFNVSPMSSRFPDAVMDNRPLDNR